MCGRCGISVGTDGRRCVDGEVYRFELAVGDVWKVWRIGWK